MEADDNAAPDKNRVEPLSPMSPFSPLSPKTPPLEGEPTPKQKGKHEQCSFRMTPDVYFFQCYKIFRYKKRVCII